MSLTIAQNMRALLAMSTHRWSRCWELRPDPIYGLQPIRVTDHNSTLEFLGFDYEPSGGGSLSALRALADLEESNGDFQGVLTSDKITHEDLWAGRYREAEINLYLIDHRYPWEGRYKHARNWVTETRFDREVWGATLTGIPSWLRMESGFVHGRTCDRTLYDAGCGVSKGEFAMAPSSMEVATVVTDRLVFTTSDQTNTQSDGYYNGGELLWITGPNEGVKSQIKVYTESIPTAAVQIELELRTPHPISVGDAFASWRGCNKLGRTGDCKLIFDNMPNFRGYQDMPGTDRMVQTPTA